MGQEQRNLEVVARWRDFYNTDVGRMVEECYAEDAEISVMGVVSFRGRATLHKAEAAVLTAAPDRSFEITRTVASGNVVAVEAVLRATDQASGRPVEAPFCAVLTFRDGLIISDHTYLDPRSWPGMARPEKTGATASA
jgi:ketosteroid isomerase-like protein